MARHPNKNYGDGDDDDRMDSIKHLEERTASIQAENKQIGENQEIANFKGFPKEGETREQLLDRIRRMRDEKPKPVEATIFRSEGLQKEYDAEVKAGQEAVAKATAQVEKYRALVQAAAAEGEKNKVGKAG